MGEIKAIPTIYNGIEFRSRLEARWAVFFDFCGVRWEYEPEGFDLGNGLWYLPDFLVHDIRLSRGWDDENNEHTFIGDVWFEVKGKMDETDANKVRMFAGDLEEDDECLIPFRERPIFVLGNIPKGDNLFALEVSAGNEMHANSYPRIDPKERIGTNCIAPFLFSSICDWDISALLTIGKDYKLQLYNCGREKDTNEPLTVLAYNKASQAKFDHARTPRSLEMADAMQDAIRDLEVIENGDWF